MSIGNDNTHNHIDVNPVFFFLHMLNLDKQWVFNFKYTNPVEKKMNYSDMNKTKYMLNSAT